MSNGDHKYTRRRFMRVGALAGVAGLAGCTGGTPSSGSDPTEGGSTENGGPDPVTTQTGDSGPETTSPPDIDWQQSDLTVTELDTRGSSQLNTVALDGDTALVGDQEADTEAGPDMGAVFVYRRTEDGWSQQTRLLAEDGNPGDRFGDAVALDGDTALIGASKDPNGDEPGSAYIFSRTDGQWDQQTKFTPGEDGDADSFGADLSLDGDTALIGANIDDSENGEDAGSAYVFSRGSDGWSQKAKLTPGDGHAGDRFGTSTALDNGTALIGAWYDNATINRWGASGSTTTPSDRVGGSAYVFKRDGEEWVQESKLFIEGSEADDINRFGEAVALAGDTALVVDDEDDNDHGDQAGSVYVFVETSDGWERQDRLVAPDGGSQDQFGESVVLTADTALIGAYRDERENGDAAGSAYIFSRSDGEWEHQTKLLPSDGDVGVSLGVTSALDRGTALVGADGASYVFEAS